MLNVTCSQLYRTDTRYLVASKDTFMINFFIKGTILILGNKLCKFLCENLKKKKTEI